VKRKKLPDVEKTCAWAVQQDHQASKVGTIKGIYATSTKAIFENRYLYG
jgi:hypothetical protein